VNATSFMVLSIGYNRHFSLECIDTKDNNTLSGQALNNNKKLNGFGCKGMHTH
jgi:hypothetical protein